MSEIDGRRMHIEEEHPSRPPKNCEHKNLTDSSRIVYFIIIYLRSEERACNLNLRLISV